MVEEILLLHCVFIELYVNPKQVFFEKSVEICTQPQRNYHHVPD